MKQNFPTEHFSFYMRYYLGTGAWEAGCFISLNQCIDGNCGFHSACEFKGPISRMLSPLRFMEGFFLLINVYNQKLKSHWTDDVSNTLIYGRLGHSERVME